MNSFNTISSLNMYLDDLKKYKTVEPEYFGTQIKKQYPNIDFWQNKDYEDFIGNILSCNLEQLEQLKKVDLNFEGSDVLKGVIKIYYRIVYLHEEDKKV